MDFRIDNDGFSARVSRLGSELRSLTDRAAGRELMWQADPAWWKGTAPILFPIVGGLKGGAYRHDGHEYRLGQHGFARTSEFSLRGQGPEWVELGLVASAATRECYPFEFDFVARFGLERAGLDVRYRVENRGSNEMLFSVGSHPAFVMPFDGGSLENYFVLFETGEDSPRLFFKDGCTVAGRTGEAFATSRIIGLSRKMFDDGPIILPTVRSARVTLCKSGGTRSLEVRTGGAPSLALWSKPNASFLCVEPWFGLPDSTDATGNLADKTGILRLEPGAAWTGGWGVSVATGATS